MVCFYIYINKILLNENVKKKIYMIRLTNRQILLLKVFKDYDGFNGKINTQKIIFAFQTAKLINFHYIFRTGFYGPFCEGLEQDLNYLCEVGLLIEEPYGRLRVNDNLTNKSFFNRFKDLFTLFDKNKLLENKIVELLEYDLRTSKRIELASSFIYLIKSKEIHKKDVLFNTIDNWKPGVFIDDEKEDVWNIIIQNNIINEKGELTFPIVDNDKTRDIFESFVYIENSDLNSSNYNIEFIGFDEMSKIIYKNSFWTDVVKDIINRTECKYWDFKQTLEMWNTSNLLKEKKQIELAEKIAAFANKKGGIIFIGITDKIPRRIMGVSNLENRIQSISTILDKWIDYQEEFFELREIILKDSSDIEKRCIAIIIAQTKEPVGIKTLNGYYSYPVRLETGLRRENFTKINKKKIVIPTTNFNFLNLLNNGL